jgi:non-specific serine/threonine protein kinase
LPLAIELAAARLQLLTPAGLLARSDHLLELLSGGRGERSDHDALRSMLGWSYGLLSEPAQRTLCRLACFAGAFAVEAAESVVGDLDGGSVLDALGELVDHSMLRLTRTGGTVRLVLLDTIREFAEELLSTTGERTDVEQRHDEWYAALSARAAREVRGAGQRDAIARLDEDRADIISTIVCAADRGDDVLVCRLAISMAPYWDVCGELSQARRWLDRAAMDATPTRLRATAGTWAAYFAMLQGDYNAAEDHARHALALYADDPESVGVAYAQLMLGQSHAERGDLDAAADLLHAATTGFTDHDDRWGLARALNTQAEIAYIREDCTSALELHTAALGNFDDIGDEYSKAYVLTGLGNVQLKLGAIAEAAATARAALAWALETNNRFQIAAAAELCARTAMQENKTNDAERLRRLAQLLRSAIGAAPTARYRSNLHDIDRSPAGRPLTPAGVNPTETADLLAWAATWTDNA